MQTIRSRPPTLFMKLEHKSLAGGISLVEAFEEYQKNFSFEGGFGDEVKTRKRPSIKHLSSRTRQFEESMSMNGKKVGVRNPRIVSTTDSFTITTQCS